MQRCICGLRHYLYRVTRSGMTIMRRVVRSSDVSLTKPGTKLHDCLLLVAGYHPNAVSTGDLARAAGIETKLVSARVSVLMARGLINRVQGGKGLLDGSTWRLSDEAVKLLRLDERPKELEDYEDEWTYDWRQGR